MYPSRISIKTKQTIEIENCPKSSLIKIAGLKPTIDGQKHVISVFLVFVSLDQSVFYRCLLVKPGTSCHIGFVSVCSRLFLQKFAKTTEYVEANLSRFQRFIMVQPCSFHPFFPLSRVTVFAPAILLLATFHPTFFAERMRSHKGMEAFRKVNGATQALEMHSWDA